MSHLFWLTEQQIERIKPFFPKKRGVNRADDRKVFSGIVYVIKNSLRWVGAPAEYGPHKTLYKARHKIENLFAKLKDWRRIAPRYDRCAHTFRSAIYLAATVIFWL